MKRTILPITEPRCRPTKACSRQDDCARFRNDIPPGAPLIDYGHWGATINGQCLQFVPTRAAEAKPSARPVLKPIKGLV